MNILLIAVNQEKAPYPVEPIGALLVAEALRLRGYDVKLIDLCFDPDSRKTILEALNNFKPGIIGFSIRNIDNTTYPNTKFYIPEIKELIKLCKNNSDALCVMGGSGFSMMPLELLKYLEVSIGIAGEGEEAMCQLVKQVEEGSFQFEHIPGIVYYENGCYKKNNPQFINSFTSDFSLIPDREEINTERYLKEGSIVNIQTKRGCAFKCIYCTYPVIEGRKVRCRSVSAVIEELKLLNQKYFVKHFFFVDSIFNFPLDHALSLCEEIIRSGLHISWTTTLQPRYVTEELISLMSQAGCSGVEIGIDSASEKLLKNLRKGFALKDLVNTLDLCKKYNLKVCCYLLLGGPGEDMETVNESINFLTRYSPTTTVIQTGLRIYPGTELEQIALKEGYQLSHILEPLFYISKELEETLIPNIKQITSGISGFVYEGIRTHKMSRLLKRMRKLGFEGHLWEMDLGAPV